MQIRTIKDIERIERQNKLEDILQFDNTYSAIRHTADNKPDNTAISFFLSAEHYETAVDISYRELIEKITQTANFFNSLGLTDESTIAFLLPNLPETHYVVWGAEAACRVLAVNPLLEPQQIRDLLNSAQASVVVTMNPMPGMDLWEKVDAILPELTSVSHVVGVDIAQYTTGMKGILASALQKYKRPKSVSCKGKRYHNFTDATQMMNAQTLEFDRVFTDNTVSSMYCTGGTTGLPKIAVRSHRNELMNASSILLMGEELAGDGKSILCGLPLFHVNGILNTGLIPFMAGARVIMMTPQGYRGDGVFPNFWKIIEHFQVNAFSAVPTILSALLQIPVKNNDISSLEICICGSAPLPVEIFKQFEKQIGVKILEGYGLTEGTCVSSINPPEGESQIGSIGLRLPFQQMICGNTTEDGSIIPCKTNEIGSVLIRGPNVFLGYKEKHQNEGLWFTDIEGQTWLNTGDLGRQDEHGYFWLTGRKKEMIIRGGHNIEPKIIEEVMCKHPHVSLAAAVGRPDNHAGEVPVCYVQMSEGSTTPVDELMAFAKQHIPERAAIPKEICILPSLPTTAVGKVFKPKLEMREIKACVEQVIHKLLPARSFTVDINQNSKQGTLANIRVKANELELVELESNLGRYIINFEIQTD